MPILQEIETALAKGHVWAAMRNGRWWRLRRNGKTKTWKTRPGEFLIPVKAGLRSYTAITDKANWVDHFTITEGDPNV